MTEGSRAEGHLKRVADALERLAVAVEVLAFPSAPQALEGPETSQVSYVDDAAQLELEMRQQAYWESAGRKLDPWEAPPRPVDEHGRQWNAPRPDSSEEDPEARA